MCVRSTSARDRHSQFPLSPQVVCAQCGSYSGHLFERLGGELGTGDGLSMTNSFCAGLVDACSGQIEFPTYDGQDYCTKHTGGGEDLYWSYPYMKREATDECRGRVQVQQTVAVLPTIS